MKMREDATSTTSTTPTRPITTTTVDI